MKKNILEYNVDVKQELLEYLYNNVNKSKNNIKSFLKNGNVYVNNKVITKHNYMLNIGDKIVIKLFNSSLDILYEDESIIAVNKKSGLLTVSTDKIKDKTLFREVSNYVKKNNKNNKVFIVNRIDKDTSGIVVFAKNERVKEILQSKWNDIVKVRKYVAVVEGITLEKGTIKSYLNENKEHIVYSSKNGKLAITDYERVKYNNNYTMLNVYLSTGRKNQIRVHMKDINHPVIGDFKYGNKMSPINRLMLHSEYIEFISPINNKIIKISCPYPIEFDSVF